MEATDVTLESYDPSASANASRTQLGGERRQR